MPNKFAAVLITVGGKRKEQIGARETELDNGNKARLLTRRISI